MIIPKDELVDRPPTQGLQWFQSKLPSDIISDEDNWRCPQRVCDPCSFQLKDLQPDLRQQVSRYVCPPVSVGHCLGLIRVLSFRVFR